MENEAQKENRKVQQNFERLLDYSQRGVFGPGLAFYNWRLAFLETKIAIYAMIAIYNYIAIIANHTNYI